MSLVVGYLLVFALPTAVGFAIVGALRAARWLGEAHRTARFRALPPEPIERLAADLRRLRAELEDTETRSWRRRFGSAALTYAGMCGKRPYPEGVRQERRCRARPVP